MTNTHFLCLYDLSLLKLKLYITTLSVYFQCCEMLDNLGVPYVHSPGEAEATCAALNASGVSKLMSCLFCGIEHCSGWFSMKFF